MQAANRVVMNTGLLYGKMLVTIFISCTLPGLC